LDAEKYMNKLLGRTDIEDALKRLEKLTQDEAAMATAQNLKVTHAVDDKATTIDVKLTEIINGVPRNFTLWPSQS
jgi:hypothetical protein